MAITDINAGTILPQTGYTAPTSANLGSRLVSLLSNLLGFITIIAGLAFLFYFIFGAINWITSAGDPKKLEAARLTITNALVGLAITVIAYPILTIISQLLGIELADPLSLLNAFK